MASVCFLRGKIKWKNVERQLEELTLPRATSAPWRGLRSCSSRTETEDESETGSLVLLASHQAETMETTKGKRNPWQGAEQSPAVWAKPRAGLFFSHINSHSSPSHKKKYISNTPNGIVRSESQLDLLRNFQGWCGGVWHLPGREGSASPQGPRTNSALPGGSSKGNIWMPLILYPYGGFDFSLLGGNKPLTPPIRATH